MIINPILTGFNPDPSILRIDNCYYIAVSSFEWFPGIPIYRSYDLKNWELYTHAITRKEQADLIGIESAQGVWAPSLSYNQNKKKFYITYSIVLSCEHNNFDVDNYVMESDCIKNGWSDAIYINSSGFDPSMFHDTDGTSYIVNLEWESRQGYEHPGTIILQAYDLDKKCLYGNVFHISNGSTNRGCLEGPNIYKKGKYYYLVTAEGGTGFGHCVAVARSENIRGPYESYYGNPIITSQPIDFEERGIGDSAKPWRYYPDSILQKSGHGSIVETTTGDVYIAHLCSRPFVPELRSTLGRETALQKCVWTEDNWIKLERSDNMAQIEVVSSDLPEHSFAQNDENELFVIEDGKKRLPNSFYTLREAVHHSWIQINQNNHILLRGRNTLFSKYNQSLIGKKVKSFHFEVTVKINYSPESFLQSAGLTNYYCNNTFYYLRMYYSQTMGGKALGILKSDQGIKTEYSESHIRLDDHAESVYMRCIVQNKDLQYFYSLDGNEWIKIGNVLDITILSDEYVGGFTGSFVGVTTQDLYTKSKWCTIEQFETKAELKK